jgi:hypothetical protein
MKQYRNVNANWGDSFIATFEEFRNQAMESNTEIRQTIRKQCDVIIDSDNEVIAVSIDDYNDNQAW